MGPDVNVNAVNLIIRFLREYGNREDLRSSFRGYICSTFKVEERLPL